jgi:hypothetical protein
MHRTHQPLALKQSSLCLIYHCQEECRKVKAWIHPCFTLALDGGRWSLSYSQPLYIQKLEKEGWVSPRAGLDAANRKYLFLNQGKTPFFSH